MIAVLTCWRRYLPFLCLVLAAGCSWLKDPEEPSPITPRSSIEATDGEYDDKIIIGWEAIDGASSYRIVRADTPQGTYARIDSVAGDLWCEDASVAAGVHYFYRVIGLGATGSVVDCTGFDEGFACVGSALGAARGVNASNGTSGSSIQVVWDSVSGASHYAVLRYRAIAGDYNPVGTVANATAFEDTSAAPGPYYYRISAYGDDGAEGAYSAPDTGYRAVTDREFFLQFDSTVVRSNEKFTVMGTAANEIVAGDISGTCEYHTDVYVNDVRVTITYTNYCDHYLTLDGAQVSRTDWGGNGSLSGTVRARGIYNGSVEYHLDLADKDVAVDSTSHYRICQDINNGACSNVYYCTIDR